MARLTDWSPLADSDPVPGDPSEVERMGKHYRSVADTILRAAGNLRRLANSGEEMTSDAVEALEENCDQVASDISRAEERYRGVGDALIAYAPELETAQADSLTALSNAQAAESSQEAAHRRGERADTPEATQQANRDAQDAASDLTTARNQLRDAEDIRDRAAQTAINAIKDVEDTGDLNDSWWDNWGAKVVSIIQQIASAVALVCGVLALLVGWIPIIGQALAAVLGTIALIATAVSLICNIALAATGYGDWGSVVWDVVSLATFGIGRVFSAAARGSTAAVRGGSRMAAGSMRGAGGARISTLMGGRSSLSAMSRGQARNLLQQGRRTGALTRSNIVSSIRSVPGDFTDALATLRSGSNWSRAGSQAGPAFRNIFNGGGLPALYGQTDVVAANTLLRGMDPALRSSPLVVETANRTAALTLGAVGANIGGHVADGVNAGSLFGGDGFDLHLDPDPAVR